MENGINQESPLLAKTRKEVFNIVDVRIKYVTI